ncbi:multiple C2 and transmembrane domain-containing protein 1-like isoform X2 [Vanacampus margaritifer]
MFRRIKRRGTAALDRVFSSSQPDLVCSSRRDEESSERTLCGRQPAVGDHFAGLVPTHHESSSLGSASLMDPLGRTCGGGRGGGGGGGGEARKTTTGAHLEEQHGPDPGGARASAVPPECSRTYALEVELRRGRNLAVRDRRGSSDPYVKFKLAGRDVFRSRAVRENLDPVWNQKTTLVTQDLGEPLHVKVLDYDFGLQDDFMGSAVLHLDSLELHRLTPVTLVLGDPQHPEEDLGSLELTVRLAHRSGTAERRGESTQSSGHLPEVLGASQRWRGVVSVALIGGRDLVPMDPNGLSDPYVKFRLGAQKYRSKTLEKTLSPQWREQFDLVLLEETADVLEVTVWDHDTGLRDDFIGRCQLDLSTLAKEQTHRLELPLEESRGHLVLLVTPTASALPLAASPCGLRDGGGDALKRYGLLKSFSDMKDVGAVQVKVLRAEGLMAADVTVLLLFWPGKSDPFCVLELNNERRRTQTVYKNLNPHWNKVFTFKVKDIHSVLEVTVLDEDRDRSADFLGKVAIPLLRVRSGEQKAYVLKNKELKGRSKGVLFLEVHVVFNAVKAALRTLSPAEQKLIQDEPKVSKTLLHRNFVRARRCIVALFDSASVINSCFRWESTRRSLVAFLVFVVVVWNFQVFMIPLALLLLLVWNFFLSRTRQTADTSMEDMLEWDEDDKEEAESRGFLDKLNGIQDVFISVQKTLDQAASYGERLKNVLNWTVPFLSVLAVVALCLLAFLLYVVPLRYLVLAWGVNKFTKKLRDPYAVDNNEIVDFLSRVPSDVQVMQYHNLQVDVGQSPSKRKRTNPS